MRGGAGWSPLIVSIFPTSKISQYRIDSGTSHGRRHALRLQCVGTQGFRGRMSKASMARSRLYQRNPSATTSRGCWEIRTLIRESWNYRHRLFPIVNGYWKWQLRANRYSLQFARRRFAARSGKLSTPSLSRRPHGRIFAEDGRCRNYSSYSLWASLAFAGTGFVTRPSSVTYCSDLQFERLRPRHPGVGGQDQPARRFVDVDWRVNGVRSRGGGA